MEPLVPWSSELWPRRCEAEEIGLLHVIHTSRWHGLGNILLVHEDEEHTHTWRVSCLVHIMQLFPCWNTVCRGVHRRNGRKNPMKGVLNEWCLDIEWMPIDIDLDLQQWQLIGSGASSETTPHRASHWDICRIERVCKKWRFPLNSPWYHDR